MDIVFLCSAAYDNAVVKHFHDTERSLDTDLLLITSEIIEAAECLRDNCKPSVFWISAGENKPEGICAELADVAIRCGDTLRSRNLVVSDPLELSTVPVLCTPDALSGLIRLVYAGNFETTLRTAYQMIASFGEDPEKVVNQKMLYNASRPARHGGKLF